jgi:hypothetical protein
MQRDNASLFHLQQFILQSLNPLMHFCWSYGSTVIEYLQRIHTNRFYWTLYSMQGV